MQYKKRTHYGKTKHEQLRILAYLMELDTTIRNGETKGKQHEQKTGIRRWKELFRPFQARRRKLNHLQKIDFSAIFFP